MTNTKKYQTKKKRKLSDADTASEAKRLRTMVNNLTAENLSLYREIDSLRRQVGPVVTLQKGRKHVHDLPDQLLLRVLSCLDPLFVADVVALVCRRWRILAADPLLWEDRVVCYGNKGQGTRADAVRFMRTLAAASYASLDTLECGLSVHDPAELAPALEDCRTSCKHLCLALDVAAPEAVLRLLHNSRRQLTSLCVCEGPMSSSAFSPQQAARFWQLIEEAGSNKLETLLLFLSQHSGLIWTPHFFRPVPHSKLRILKVDVGVTGEVQASALASTLSSLISAHRSSLSEVRLPWKVPTGASLRALSRCGVMYHVRLPATWELSRLADCPQLSELWLYLDPLQHTPPASLLLPALSRLENLQVLCVQLVEPRCAQFAGLEAELVRAVLEQLPGLRELGVTSLPPADVLEELADVCSSPENLITNLEVLTFKECCGDDARAEVASCRLDALQRLLGALPRLHIMQESLAVGAKCTPEHRELVTRVELKPSILVASGYHDLSQACYRCAVLTSHGGSVLYLFETPQHTSWVGPTTVNAVADSSYIVRGVSSVDTTGQKTAHFEHQNDPGPRLTSKRSICQTSARKSGLHLPIRVVEVLNHAGSLAMSTAVSTPAPSNSATTLAIMPSDPRTMSNPVLTAKAQVVSDGSGAVTLSSDMDAISRIAAAEDSSGTPDEIKKLPKDSIKKSQREVIKKHPKDYDGEYLPPGSRSTASKVLKGTKSPKSTKKTRAVKGVSKKVPSGPRKQGNKRSKKGSALTDDFGLLMTTRIETSINCVVASSGAVGGSQALGSANVTEPAGQGNDRSLMKIAKYKYTPNQNNSSLLLCNFRGSDLNVVNSLAQIRSPFPQSANRNLTSPVDPVRVPPYSRAIEAIPATAYYHLKEELTNRCPVVDQNLAFNTLDCALNGEIQRNPESSCALVPIREKPEKIRDHNSNELYEVDSNSIEVPRASTKNDSEDFPNNN